MRLKVYKASPGNHPIGFPWVVAVYRNGRMVQSPTYMDSWEWAIKKALWLFKWWTGKAIA